MRFLLIAIAVMVAATIAVHLALPQAISNVVGKVSKCHKCMTFWSTLIVLAWLGCNVFIAAGLSLCMSYLSNWFGLLLIWLNEKYTELWRRLNKQE